MKFKEVQRNNRETNSCDYVKEVRKTQRGKFYY